MCCENITIIPILIAGLACGPSSGAVKNGRRSGEATKPHRELWPARARRPDAHDVCSEAAHPLWQSAMHLGPAI